MGRETKDSMTGRGAASFGLPSAHIIVGLLLLYAALLAGTWSRWGAVTMDSGAALDRAARIAAGAVLYRDIQSVYGPVGAYAMGALFRILGIHLNVAYGAGIVLLLAESCLLWFICRRLLTEAECAVGLVAFWMLALQPGVFNWILPNTFAATFGAFFSTAALALVIADLDRPGTVKLVGASLCTAAAGLSKVEFGAAAFGTAMAAVLLFSHHGRGRMRATATLILPGLLLSVAVVSILAWLVPWRELLLDNLYRIRMFKFAQPAYIRHLFPPLGPVVMDAVLRYGVEFTGRAALVAAGLHLAAAAGSRRPLGALLAGAGLLVPLLPGYSPPLDFLPSFRASPFMWAPVGWLVVAAVALVRGRRTSAAEGPALVVVAAFNVLLTLRWGLRVAWPSYYGFFAPFLVLLVVRSLLAVVAPRRAALAATLVVATAVLSGTLLTVRVYRSHSYVLEYPRGRIRMVPSMGKPLRETIDYVRANTAPDDLVAVLPEERIINLLAERKHPGRAPALWPGWLATPEDQLGFVQELEQQGTKTVVVSDRRYYGSGLGRLATYNRRVMQYVIRRYRKVWTSSRGTYTVYRRWEGGARRFTGSAGAAARGDADGGKR
jgi:hypothetical protein